MALHDPTVFDYLTEPTEETTTVGLLRAWLHGFINPDADPLETIPEHRLPPLRDRIVFPPGYVEDREFLIVDRRAHGLFTCVLSGVRGAASVRRFDRFEEALVKVRPDNCADCVMIVDIDTFPTISMALDMLQNFRAEYPPATVIIASTLFVRNDFSRERRCIADASVRLPSGRAQTALAIASAIESNGAVREIAVA